MSDDWDFYPLRVDDQPASIFVDLGIRSEAPIRSHETMGYLRVLMRRPRDDGFSSQGEFDDLLALEDGVTAKIIRDGTAIFVGRNTSNGNRDFYFYVVDPARFAAAAEAAMREFPAYKYETGAREDRDWQTYFEFLHPSESDLQCIMNRRVLRQLDKHGDDASKERKIEHFAYFPSVEVRAAFADYVQAEGYAIENAPEVPDGEGQYSILFSRVDRAVRIDEIVLPLFERATELGGEYDGWSCQVSR
jgi:regulator of RNase E activity RraB